MTPLAQRDDEAELARRMTLPVLGGRMSVTDSEAGSLLLQMSTGSSFADACIGLGINPGAGMAYFRADSDRWRQYNRARLNQMELWVDDIVRAAAEPVKTVKTITNSNGEMTEIVHDSVDRSRLIIDTKKWVMERLSRERFGAKIETTLEVGDGLTALLARIREAGATEIDVTPQPEENDLGFLA